MQRISMGDSTPESPTISNSFVTVEVGDPIFSHPYRDTFLVPRAVLTRSSRHLRTRLASPHTIAINLLDVGAHLFSSYLDWLNISYVKEHSYHRLAELFALAATLQDDDFSRAVLQDIIHMAQETNSYPDLSAINIIYGSSKRGSGARKLLTDFYVYGVNQAWLQAFEAVEERADWDYIDQVFVALARPRAEREFPWVSDAAAYFGEGSEDKEGDDGDMTSCDMSDDEEDDADINIDSPSTLRMLEERERVLTEDIQMAMDVNKEFSPTTPLSTGRPPAPGCAVPLADRTRSWNEEAL